MKFLIILLFINIFSYKIENKSNYTHQCLENKSNYTFIFDNDDKTYLNSLDLNNGLKGKYISNKLENIENIEIKYKNFSLIQDQCPCQCNFSSIGILDGNGYGRYCGIKYTCNNTSEPGCNQVDDCCRLHDMCVGNLGYCNSCICNLKLINCLEDIIWSNNKQNKIKLSNINNEFYCNTTAIQKQADYTIISDICDIIKYVPSYMCGGCPNNTTIPQICYS